jgi:hypothetical protein
MMKNIIIRFKYQNLRNEAHVEFHTTFNSLVERFTPAELGIETLYTVYKPLYEQEVTALDQIRKSALTPVIEEHEKERELLFRGFSGAVKSYLRHFDEGKREAARKIEIVLEHYGNIAAKPYDEETAAIEDLHRELQKPENAPSVAALDLGDWLGHLVQVSRTFDGLLMARYDEMAKRPDLHMRSIRKEVDKVFRAILNLLESLVQVNGPDTNKDFLAELNAVMKRYKDILAQEAGRRSPKKDLGAGDHTIVEPIPTQTYTGKAVVVIPKVHYREDEKPTVELVFAVDFAVTYKNNTEAGTADLIIHGTGKYKGQKTVTFNIAR